MMGADELPKRCPDCGEPVENFFDHITGCPTPWADRWWNLTWPLRRRWRQFRSWQSTLMLRCRVCGKTDDVMVGDPRGLWAYPWRKTYCPAHCPDHDYEYDRDMRGRCCTICAAPAPDDWNYPDY